MTELEQRIASEIRARGPIPFAEFMRRALYDPAHGYYSMARPLGQRGDFFTSVSVGLLFGELLAFQFARWQDGMANASGPFQIVEAGAHDGQLARDILKSFRQHEAIEFSRTEYWIVEPSAQRRSAQEKRLELFPNVRWFETLEEIRGRVSGVIFSNELLDAMPAHSFAWNALRRCWEERAVSVVNEELTWTTLPQPIAHPPDFPEALLDVLPHGYIFEQSPAARHWWGDAAAALVQGRLMTIDYGGTMEELLSPSRTSGTLRAYSRHRVSTNILANPGEQDITLHVNFTELIQMGERGGLVTDGFISQSQFLTEAAR